MKAVVVELNKGFAAVLSDDGCIASIKNNNYEVGQVIQLHNSRVQFVKKFTIMAASAAAFVILSAGTWAYASPYSYVSLDVNPSIEFTLNRFDRVIGVKAVNDDGEELLQEIVLHDLKNKTIEAAITNTVEQISELGYFGGEVEGGIVIATSGQNMDKADDLATELQDTIETEVAKLEDEVVVEAISVGLERVEEARELGISPGKLNLIEKLQDAAGDTSEINVEEWRSRPVKEIMKATKDYRKEKDPGSDAKLDHKDVTDNNITAPPEDQKHEDEALKQANKEAEKALKEAEKAEAKAKADEKKAKDKAEKAKVDEERSKAPSDKDKDQDKDKTKNNSNKIDNKNKDKQDKENRDDKNKASNGNSRGNGKK